MNEVFIRTDLRGFLVPLVFLVFADIMPIMFMSSINKVLRNTYFILFIGVIFLLKSIKTQ